LAIQIAGPRTRTRPSWASDHLALIVSGVLLCSMTVKVILVSHGDAVTVSSIVSRQGLTGLAAITFAVGLPSLVSLLALLASSMLGEALREEDGLRGPSVALGVALLLALVFSPVKMLLGLLAFSAVTVAISVAIRLLRARRAAGSKPLPFYLRKAGQTQNASISLLLALATFLAMSGLVLNDSLWLPKERLTVLQKPLMGYVIAGDGDFTHLILEHSRQTLVLKTSEVEQRALCGRSEDERSLPIRLLWPENATYQSCD
jgi:hypothetical protein